MVFGMENSMMILPHPCIEALSGQNTGTTLRLAAKTMYKLCVHRDFIASHFLIGGDWGYENFPYLIITGWKCFYMGTLWINTATW
jgi:hypothetical protein